MSQTLKETAADIEAMLVSSITDLFDEVIVPNYGKTTSDGVALGPKWWSQKLEANGIVIKPNAVRMRVSRRRSEAESGSTARETNSRIGRAVNTLRDPAKAAKALEDPDVRSAFADAIRSDTNVARDAAKALDERYAAPPRRADTGRDAYDDATELLVKLRSVQRQLRDAVTLAQDIRGLGADDMRASVQEICRGIRLAVDALETGADGGSMDDKLTALLDAEAGQ